MLARFRSETLGLVFQRFNLIDGLTIPENVQLGLAYRTDRAIERRTRVAAAMDKDGIAHRARHYPHQLSGGQQQRAAIARAIIGDPKLIRTDDRGTIIRDCSEGVAGRLLFSSQLTGLGVASIVATVFLNYVDLRTDGCFRSAC